MAQDDQYQKHYVYVRSRLVGRQWSLLCSVMAINRAHAIDLVFGRKTKTGRLSKYRPSLWEDNVRKDGSCEQPLITSYASEACARLVSSGENSLSPEECLSPTGDETHE